MRTARVHHAARRRGGGVAAGGACAAAGQAADHRVPWARARLRREPMDRRFCAAAARTRLDRGSQHRDRVSLGGGTQRALRRDRGRVRPAEGRCHCHGGNRSGCRSKAGDIGHPDRLRGGGRPGRQRPGRESGATGRQCHRPVDPVGRSCRQATRTLARGCPRSPPVGDLGQCRLSPAVLEMREVQAAARTLGLEVATSKSGERRISRPPSRRSRAARTHFMSRPIRSLPPTGFASTPWRWARDCRRCTARGNTSKREV